MGGDNITEKIVETFNISETEAERIKVTYGIDKRQMSFKPAVCSSDDGQGNEIKHYTDELNAAIKSELDEFLTLLSDCMNDLLNGYDKVTKGLPMILIGGGSKLNGLVEYIEPKVPKDRLWP